ncbi:MAG: multidrug effflux MFS transporter [Pseudomonadota bacterium]
MTRTPPHLLTLIVLTAFAPLSLNMFTPSLTRMAADLGTDYATITLAVSGYLAVTTVVQLIIGPLSDRVGRRPVLLAVLSVFAVASLGCVLAQNATTFLAFRILQGGMVAGYTLSLAVVRDTRPEREAVSLIGYIGMAMALGPMFGPLVGGALDQVFGWRATFVFYTVAGALLLAVCVVDFGETRVPVRDGTRPSPWVLLRVPTFWAFALCGTFSVGAFYIFITGAPLVAVSTFGSSAATLGIYIGSITLGFMAGGFLSGRFGKDLPLTTMIIAGRLVACGGLTLGLVLWSAGLVTPAVFFGATICVGLGNGLTMPASNTGAMSVEPSLAGSAAGLSGALVVAGGAVLTALTGALVPEDGGGTILLVTMLGSSAAALFMGLWAAWLRRQDKATA